MPATVRYVAMTYPGSVTTYVVECPECDITKAPAAFTGLYGRDLAKQFAGQHNAEVHP